MVSLPGILNFPTSLDDATSLISSANNAATVLTAGYTAGDTTLTVASNALLTSSGLVTIGVVGLVLKYTGVSGGTGLTGVSRASTALEPNNPADTNVANGSAVEQRITAGTLGVVRSAILALQAKLGISADTAASGDFLKGTGAGSSAWSALASGEVTTALGYTPANWRGLQIMADDQAGADLGAKINAADAALGALAGTIVVLQTGTISTAVSISANHVLRFGPGTFTQSVAITLNGAGAAVVGAGEQTTIINNSDAAAHSITIADGVAWPRIEHLKLVRTTTPSFGTHGVNQAGVTDHALIRNVWSEAHHRGFLLGPCGSCRIEDCTAHANTGQGVLLQNTAALGTLQWNISDVLLTQNGGAGIYVNPIAGPSQISLGNWTRISTFANTSYGANILGTAGVPVHGVRMQNCFWGENGESGVQLATFGGLHRIQDCFFELAGSRTTGPTLATAASNVGRGLIVGANDLDVEVIGCMFNGNKFSGAHFLNSHTVFDGNICTNNGGAAAGGEQSGVRFNCSAVAEATGNLCANIGGSTTQLYGIYSDQDACVLVGNSVEGTTEAIHFVTGPAASQVFANKPISGAIGATSNIADSFSIADAKNIILSTTTGTKIGTAANQKLGLWGATPVVQAGATSDLRVALVNAGIIATGGASPLNLNGGALTTTGDSALGQITVTDAKNIILGTGTGTKIGTAITQKLGFYNATPVVQRAAAAQAAAPAGGTGATAGAYDTAAHRDALINLVNEMRTVLVSLGLMKGSA